MLKKSSVNSLKTCPRVILGQLSFGLVMVLKKSSRYIPTILSVNRAPCLYDAHVIFIEPQVVPGRCSRSGCGSCRCSVRSSPCSFHSSFASAPPNSRCTGQGRTPDHRYNKKSKLLRMRRARAYNSSCSQVIMASLHQFRRNSLFCSQKSPKTPIL